MRSACLPFFLVVAACGSDPTPSTTTTTATDAATETAAPSDTSVASETTADTSAPETTESCQGATIANSCDTCLADACCAELVDCQGDADCVACVTGTDGDACERTPATHERVTRYLECRGGPCVEPCIGASTTECTGLLDGIAAPECATCLEANCCGNVSACHDEAVCWDGCFQNHDDAACHGDPDAHAVFHAFGQCIASQCEAECYPPEAEGACTVPATAPSEGACVMLGENDQCNPVTNTGCADEGASCDYGEAGFTCYPAPNERDICASCGESVGWCDPGHVCVTGTCMRFCCTDADCGAGNRCDPATIQSDTVGVCVVE